MVQVQVPVEVEEIIDQVVYQEVEKVVDRCGPSTGLPVIMYFACAKSDAIVKAGLCPMMSSRRLKWWSTRSANRFDCILSAA